MPINSRLESQATMIGLVLLSVSLLLHCSELLISLQNHDRCITGKCIGRVASERVNARDNK